MVFKGKVATWYWVITIGTFVMLAWAFWVVLSAGESTSQSDLLILIGTSVSTVFITLSFALRNKIILESGHLTICFGVVTKRLDYTDVAKIYRTNDPVASFSLAASLDRVALEKPNRQTVLVSLQDNDAFISALLEKVPSIQLLPRRW